VEDSPAFATICSALESATSMSRLEARGTMRLALKVAGLEPHTVTTKPLVVIVDRVLPDLLRTRRVPDVSVVCESLKTRLLAEGALRTSSAYDSPEDILARFSRKK